MTTDASHRRDLLRAVGAGTLGTAIAGSVSGCLGLFGPTLPDCEGEQITDIAPPTKGQEDAPVTVTVFSDYGCPHCKTWTLEKAPALSDYIEDGQVRYVHLDFPIPSTGQSFPAANAARAVQYDEGLEAYWSFHRGLFENQGSLGPDTYGSLAREVGADPDRIRTAAAELPFCQVLKDERQRGSDRGVSATPTAFVEDEKFSPPDLEAIQDAIEERL